jgi:hypothetical protein
MRLFKRLIWLIMFSFLFHGSTRASTWVPDASRKLTIYIGWPVDSPSEWRRVKTYDLKKLELEDGTVSKPSEVRSYLLVYPNNEVLGGTNLFYPLPSELKFLEPEAGVTNGPLSLDSAAVALGKSTCTASHSHFRKDAQKKQIYATTLKNISQQRIRIQKFAAFRPAGDNYVLSTVSRNFYSAEQFQSWYSTAADGWLKPGEQVTDDSNYGSGPGIWAYFGETEDGKYFTTVVPLPK